MELVPADIAPLIPRALTSNEAAYLRHVHNFVTLSEHARGRNTPSWSSLSQAVDSTLQRLVEQFWTNSGTLPLHSVPHPDDSSRRLWLCHAHARAMVPRDSGNVLREPRRKEQLDVGFQRWLRVGMALKCATEELAALLDERVPRWYTSTLAATARDMVSAEYATQQRVVDLQRLLDDAAQAALLSVPGQDVPTYKQVQLQSGSKWDSLLLSLCDRYRDHPATAVETILAWKNVHQMRRRVIQLRSVMDAVGKRTNARGAALASHQLHAMAVFAQQIQGTAADTGCVRVLPLPHTKMRTVLVSYTDSQVSSGQRSPASALICRSPATSKCAKAGLSDHVSRDCLTCRAWAKAIASLHRTSTAKKFKADGWKNCISQRWSSPVSASVCVSQRHSFRASHRWRSFVHHSQSTRSVVLGRLPRRSWLVAALVYHGPAMQTSPLSSTWSTLWWDCTTARQIGKCGSQLRRTSSDSSVLC